MKFISGPVVSGRQLALGLGGASLLLFSGCQTYQQQSSSLSESFHSGNIAAAVASVDKEARDHETGKDALLWKLEQGATLRTAALSDPALLPPPPVVAPVDPAAPPLAPSAAEISASYAKRSIAAFDQAEDLVNTWDERANIKVGSEGFAIITNQANLPYRGRAYDKVMLDTYNALNHLQLGEIDAARVSLNRALQHQRDAVEINTKRILAAQKEADQARAGNVKDEKGQGASYDVAKAQTDPKTGPALSAALAESTAPGSQAYGDYVNPFAVFLDGLFFTVRGEGGADWERGRKSFERVASMIPENPYIAGDLALATAAAEGKAPENLTYVIFETGTGPFRDQLRIDIPTFLVTSRLAYVGAAFPRLKFNANYVATLSVTGGGQMANTAIVASMDSVVANDFKNEWPTVLTKTLIATATKAIIQAIVQKQMSDQNAALGFLGGLGMTVLNAATNIADTRTWLTLPKEFQYARLATPANRQLALTAGGQTRTITLDPGAVNVVYVKSVSVTAPLLVSQFVLK